MKINQLLLLGLSLVFIAGCKEQTQAPEPVQEIVALDVYKSPTCGCCGEWVSYIELEGFTTTTHHPQDLNAFKQENNIANQYQSCHTAVSENGYLFEGHVPSKFMRQFLAEKPDGAIGLAVPAMPLGSPGMEVDGKFTPYKVLLLFRDGSSQVYADVKSFADQY